MKKRSIYISFLIIIVALFLTISGLVSKGFDMTKGKGSVICWECIGLGED